MITYNSRYAKSNVLVDSDSGGSYLADRDMLSFDETTCTYYTVIQGDTLGGLAYKNYGDSSLWWVLLDANTDLESELDIVPGMVILIPPKNSVVSSL